MTLHDLFIGKPGGGAPEQFVIENRGGTGQAASGAHALYVNPRPGRPEPVTGDAVKADVDLGTVSKIGIYSTGAFGIDEIRIGSSFADATPVRNGSHDKDDDCRKDRDRHDD